MIYRERYIYSVVSAILIVIAFFIGRASVYYYNFNIILIEINKFFSIYYMAIITVFGWFAVFLVNHFLQEARIHNDYINSARLDLVRSLREYRNELTISFSNIRAYSMFANELGHPIDGWENSLEIEEELQNGCKSNINMKFWKDCLNDYEILFPEIISLQKEKLQDIDFHIDFKRNRLAAYDKECIMREKELLELSKLVEDQINNVNNIINNIQQKIFANLVR